MTKENKIIEITSPPYEQAVDGGGIFKKGYVDNHSHSKNSDIVGNRTYSNRTHNFSEGQIGSLKSNSKEKPVFDITKYHQCREDLYWNGCYGSDVYYKQFVTKNSYAHPAKASFLLIERIFKHLEYLGLLKEGMTVLDFMAGSFRIPLLASLRGYKSIGVELEEHFTKMGQDNKKFAENKIGRKLDMEIIQDDSRQLSSLLSKSDVAVLSPPYANPRTTTQEYDDKYDLRRPKGVAWGRESFRGRYGRNKENIGNLPYVAVVSPPFEQMVRGSEDKNKRIERLKNIGNEKAIQKISGISGIGGIGGYEYSDNPANIGNLKYKEMVGITSPPYQDSINSKNEIDEIKSRYERALQSGHKELAERLKRIMDGAEIGSNFKQDMRYSQNPENIGNLKDVGSIVGITSPPYADGFTIKEGGQVNKEYVKRRKEALIKQGRGDIAENLKVFEYNTSNPDNISNLKDNSFVGIISPPFLNQKGGGRDAYEGLGKSWNTDEVYGEFEKSWGGSRIKESIQKRMDNRNIGEINTFGNKGKDLSQNYLSAMLQVYKEASKVCPIICTVTKNPTRAGKLRKLDLDTSRLLELADYTIVDYHRAILFRTLKQPTLTGEIKKEHKGRLSFFKRLHLSKGVIASEYEDIIIAVRK